MKSYRPFPETMAMLLDMEGISARELHRRAVRKGWHLSQPHTNRIVNGEVRTSPEHMEAFARALNIGPETFLEYRLFEARRAYDPDVIGFAEATRNLRRLEGLEELGDEVSESLDVEATQVAGREMDSDHAQRAAGAARAAGEATRQAQAQSSETQRPKGARGTG